MPTELTSGCPQYYSAAVRNQTWNVVGSGGDEWHAVDRRGRPHIALKELLPRMAASVNTYCRSKVGNWGSPAESYQGGHLIGAQLGGWGGRLNMVPQYASFNSPVWRDVENQLALCTALSSDWQVALSVEPRYPAGSSSVVPQGWAAYVDIYNSDYSVVHSDSAIFTNADRGGPNGDAEAARIRGWLQQQGCV